MTRFGIFACAFMLLVATSSIAIAADSPSDGLSFHLRTTDDRLRGLLEEGSRSSPTFRALVHRLRRSDVVVYLWCEGAAARVSPDGRLTFVSSVGGVRYVVVRLVRLRSRDRQIALMGHELQHAVEIANAPSVVDEESLAREYRRIGYANVRTATASFDTNAAVQTGVQVLKELLRGDDGSSQADSGRAGY